MRKNDESYQEKRRVRERKRKREREREREREKVLLEIFYRSRTKMRMQLILVQLLRDEIRRLNNLSKSHPVDSHFLLQPAFIFPMPVSKSFTKLHSSFHSAKSNRSEILRMERTKENQREREREKERKKERINMNNSEFTCSCLLTMYHLS